MRYLLLKIMEMLMIYMLYPLTQKFLNLQHTPLPENDSDLLNPKKKSTQQHLLSFFNFWLLLFFVRGERKEKEWEKSYFSLLFFFF